MWSRWIKSGVLVVGVAVMILSIKIVFVVPQDQVQANFIFTNQLGVSPGVAPSASIAGDKVLWDNGLPSTALPSMQRPQL